MATYPFGPRIDGRFLKPRQVVPTVFSDEAHRRQLVSRFHSVIDHNANKRAFFDRFLRGGTGGSSGESASGASNSTTCVEESRANAVGKAVPIADDDLDEDEDTAAAALTPTIALASKDNRLMSKGASNVDSKPYCVVVVDDTPTDSTLQDQECMAWACDACTYLHRGVQEVAMLCCSVCGTARKIEGKGADRRGEGTKKRGRGEEGDTKQPPAKPRTLEAFWNKKKKQEEP